jgi:5-methylcytosine-specific restriction endonuclease McrA
MSSERVGDKIYKTVRWQKLRKLYFEMVLGVCERCGGTGKILHHKIEISESNLNNYEIVWGFDNLELVCLECHNKIHRKGDRKDYRVNEMGELVKN